MVGKNGTKVWKTLGSCPWPKSKKENRRHETRIATNRLCYVFCVDIVGMGVGISIDTSIGTYRHTYRR